MPRRVPRPPPQGIPNVHDTACHHGRLFFELYVNDSIRTVVELGSQNVNGSIRDHCPADVHYIGLDMALGDGVDVVIDPGRPLPLAAGSVDAVVTSSAFEHDTCFWDTFLELVRILRPGGLLYVNVPSNGGFHRHPLDCWRFYPDAGVALVRWTARHGIAVSLIESFIGQPRTERWADFVAVFRRHTDTPLVHRGRIADHVPAINIYDAETAPGARLRAQAAEMPDQQITIDLRKELAAAARTRSDLTGRLADLTGRLAEMTERNTAITERNAALADDLAAALRTNADLLADLCIERNETAMLRPDLAAAQHRLHELHDAHDHLNWQLQAIRNSTSWRMTAIPRRLMARLRGR